MAANVKAGDAYIDIVPRLSQNFAGDVRRSVESATAPITRQISDKLRSVGSSLRTAGLQMSAVLTLPVVGGFKMAFDAASDLNEAVNVTNLVFGESSAVLGEFSRNAAQNLGLSEAAARQLTAGIGGLLRNLGFAEDKTAAWSQQLAILGADMGSAFNVEPAEAIEAIGAAIRGETEPIRRFNVMLDDATVRARAVEMGLADTTAEVDANAKAQATLALIMEQTTAIQGDFANTADGAANQQRILKAEFENAAAVLGQQLLPIGLQLLGWAKDLLTRFTSLTPNVQKFVLIGAGLLALLGPVVSVVGALATALGFLISPVGLVIAAIVAIGVGLVIAYKRFEGFRAVVDGVVQWVRTDAIPWLQTLWTSIVEGAQQLWAAIQPAVQAVVGFLTQKWTEIVTWARTIWPQVQEAVGHVMVAIQTVISTVVGIAQVAWREFGDNILHHAQIVWSLIQTVISSVLTIIQSTIAFVLAVINGEWGQAWEAIRAAVGAAWDLIFGIVTGALAIIGNAISAGMEFVGGIFQAAWSWIVAGAAGAAGSVVSWIAGIPGSLLGLVQSFIDAGAGLGSSILSGIKNGITGALGWAADVASALVSAVKSAWNSFAGMVNDSIPNSIGWGPFSVDIDNDPIPTFHDGGIIPGTRGADVPIIGRAGEMVLNDGQQAELFRLLNAGGRGGGPFIENAYFDERPVADLEFYARHAGL